MVNVYHIFWIYSSVLGYLDYFQSLAIMNSDIIIKGVQVALLYPDLHSFEYMLILLSLVVILIYITNSNG
jgi:hypothetical protein